MSVGGCGGGETRVGGKAQRDGKERRGRRTLTDIVDRTLGRDVLRHAREHAHLVFVFWCVVEERAAQLGVVADEHARVEAACEEVLARVVELCFGQALEPDALVYVA